MGCMILQPFVTRGNRSYLDFWAVTGELWYRGYKTPTSGIHNSFPIIQYAYDTLLIMEACSQQLFALKALLNTFAGNYFPTIIQI
jgi:hypothetical protein